jgi:hypothetical protein
VVVLHHIEKTAGTSLRQMVRENVPLADVEYGPDLLSLRYEPEEAARWYRDWYVSLDGARRCRLCCVMSHSAGHILPALDRPFEALVLVRKPVDRVLSFYLHKRRNHLRRRPPGTPFNLLEKVYETLGGEGSPNAWRQFFNFQSRSLLALFHDVSDFPISKGPSPDADVLRARLRSIVEDVFFPGVQNRFERYLELLAKRYGWNVVMRRSKTNPEPERTSIVSVETIETIRAYNWLDAELYELCRSVQERHEAELSGPLSAERRAG